MIIKQRMNEYNIDQPLEDTIERTFYLLKTSIK